MLRLQQFWKLASIGLVLVAMSLLVRVTQADTNGRSGNGLMRLVSISSNGQQANADYQPDFTRGPVLSQMGNYIVFDAVASNLVENDTNGKYDIFVHDTQTGETERVSVSSSGEQANQSSFIPAISADGAVVAFVSHATNIVSGDTNGWMDVYVHNLQTNQTQRVSVSTTGQQGNFNSYRPALSGNGRYVAFDSQATNFTDSDINRYSLDVFVHDTQTHQTKLVSRSSSGQQGNAGSDNPKISSDGRYVAFHSASTNLVENDTNGKYDIFVHDTQTGETERVSVSSSGEQSNADVMTAVMSGDGRYVAFISTATNLDTNSSTGNVYIHDRHTHSTSRLGITAMSAEVDDGNLLGISADGSKISYVDDSQPGTRVIKVYDVGTHENIVVSVASNGTPANNESRFPAISSDGNAVAFYSKASNLVANDTNGFTDVFVYYANGQAPHTPEPTETTPIANPTPTSTPTSTPASSGEQVVVFIPGIAGSQLRRELALLPDEYVWPVFRDDIKEKMRLKPATQDQPSTRDNSIYTDDMIRNYDAFNIPFNIPVPGIPKLHNPIYNPFIERLIDDGKFVEYKTGGDPRKRRLSDCDTDQTSANLFVYPWDWRFGAVDAVDKDGNTDLALSLAPNNTQLLKEYIQCILKIHKEAEITLVTHSMGWFVGRSYVLQNLSDHHIKRHIAIAPPRLGAPKTIAMMLTGDWLPDLISKDLTRTLLEHFPGAHQLLPSQFYWDLAGSPFSVNNPLTKRGDVKFSEFQQVLQDYYTSPAEGVMYRSSVPFVNNMQKVYQNPAFAVLRGDTSGVEYHIIYGVTTDGDGNDIATTVNKVIEKPMWGYDGVLELHKEYDYGWTNGDETVPEASAAAMGNGYNLNGDTIPHKLRGSGMEHQKMMSESKLQDCVLALLQGEICAFDVSAATSQPTAVRYIKLWGVDKVYVTDDISTTQNLMTTTLTLGMFPDVTAKYLGDQSIMFIVTSDKQYTINFTGQGEYFESESQYGYGDNNLRVIRFSPEPAAGQHLALITTEDALTEMQVDTNGDGIPDAKVEPLADLQGDVANDTTPPVVTAAYNPTTGLAATASDTESGVESISYTVDGTHFQPFTVPVILGDQSITSVTVIAQDKAGNFSDPITVPVTIIASNTLYLPLINR